MTSKVSSKFKMYKNKNQEFVVYLRSIKIKAHVDKKTEKSKVDRQKNSCCQRSVKSKKTIEIYEMGFVERDTTRYQGYLFLIQDLDYLVIINYSVAILKLCVESVPFY